MKKLALLCLSASLLLVLSACSSGITSGNNTQTVLAQTTYSNASLSGTYSVTMISVFVNATGAPFYNAVGTVQLNGSGNITGGTLSAYSSGTTTPCVYSVSGTYSIQNTALGTASLNLSSSTKGCNATDSWQLALAAADGGAAIQFARTDGSVASGSAIKQ